ncbi:MAG: amino acid adenylation domain-containing protein, partial [Cyanobacteria bacterium P01_G01_bin.49]
MKTNNIQDLYKLSPTQQGLLFHALYDPESSVYCDQYRIAFKGNLNPSAFEQAWQLVAEPHAVLRTCFFWEEVKEPVQVVHQQVTLPLEQFDWRTIDPTSQNQKLEAYLKADQSRSYQLSQPPLMRLTLIRTDEDVYQFIWSNHHILFDGWSRFILFKEVLDRYQALNNGHQIKLKPPFPYRKYIAWLRQQNLSEAEVFWRKKLQGITAPTPLVVDKLISSVSGTEEYGEQEIELSLEKTEQLKTLARQHQLTLNTIIQGVWALLLSRYSGEDDVIFGANTSGRPVDLPGVESAVGLFINSLPVRVQVNETDFLIPWLKTLQTQQAKARQYEWSPLIEVQGWSELPKGTPLFNSLIAFENYPIDATLRQGNGTLEITDFNFINHTNYPLTIIVVPDPQLSLKLIYDLRYFDHATIKRMLGHLQTLLLGIIANQQQHLSELSLLTEAEQQQLLVKWNKTNVEYPSLCVHQLFENQVEKTPDAVAVVFEDQQLTYQQLNQRANQLAHYLSSLGVKPEVLVGIFVERSLEMVIGLLAILKAGGAYVPLDPTYPRERLQFILEETQVPVLLTQAALLEAIPQNIAQVVCLDKDSQDIAQQSQENICSGATNENLAYTIYTSGSTGKPKGVQILHSALSNFLYSMKQTPGLTEQDTLLAVTTYSFDIAALELFLPIIVGGRLVVASQKIVADGTQLLGKLKDSKATVMQATPITWQLLLKAGWSSNYPLKVLCGGEALSASLAHKILETGSQLWNLYGPTEATIWSTIYNVAPERIAESTDNSAISIGSAINNTQIYILDKQRQLVPVGVPGELYIAGDGLARGYFNRPQLTEEKFIENPLRKAGSREKIYKTGDLARYLPDGNIEFIGRIDNQVKMRGFRIELGEIEALLNTHPEVQQAVVIAQEDISGNKRLIAYVIFEQNNQSQGANQLTDFLLSKLPKYMIPSAFVPLEALPLTPNGKIDRKTLPVPESTQVLSSEIVPPSTPIENLLAGIWVEVLGIEKVGIDNDFFELGGHSLIATRVISQIRQIFQVELPLRYLFEKPTIAGLAKEIEKAIKLDLPVEAGSIEPISREQQIPLSFAQQRLWFLAQLEPNNPFYNISGAVRLQGQLNIEALEQSFNQIISRHENLRTNFQTREGEAVALIVPERPLSLSIFDLSSLSASQQEAQVKQQSAQEAEKPFDISHDPLLRVKLLRLGEQEYIILVTMHHIISDGWSIGVLLQELATLYANFSTEETLSPRELPIQYADFAVWQRQWLQGEVLETQISYWLKQLENAPKVLELPTDHPRPALQTYRGASYSFNLSKELSTSLNQLSQQQGTTLFMTLLAGFETLLWRYTAQEDIVVGSPIANRNRAELEGLIGFFVNILVLRTNLAGNPSFEELLKRVREVALGAYAHQDLPFELLVERLQPERDLSHSPLFQVMFVLQNAPMSAEWPGLTLTTLESDSETAQFDLILYMRETDSGLVGKFEYNTDLFEQSTIQRMVGHWQTLLSGVVANPKQRLSDLPLLTEADKQQLLVEWNKTEVEYPPLCVPELLEAQVEKTPDAVAVVFEDQQLTYQQLNQQANQLAHYLRSLGVKPEVLVGICLERSLEMVIGLLAILKAGGAYIPLDPNYPQKRLAYILDDSQAAVLLSDNSLLEKIPAHQAQVVDLDIHRHLIAQQSQENVFSSVTRDNLAYTIYTSGSTGKPKGVQISHSALSNFLHSMKQAPRLTEKDTFLAVTTYSFDIAALELFLPIIVGGRLVVASQKIIADGTQLLAKLKDSKATVMQATPITWRLLLAAGWQGNPQLKILCGGEALPIDLASTLLERCACLWNMYGPTETTIWSAVSKIKTDNKLIPIGHGIANTQFYILDQYNQLVPVGVAGELCIGGQGLARGYFQRTDLSAEKFIPNLDPKFPGERLYKTGDLARWLPNGDIEYIGRIDHQVKIRGFRIELGEIESQIAKYPTVQQAIVMAREDIPGDKRLVAYVVSQEEVGPKADQLRHFLQEKLPNYMIPTVFILMKTLPLTPNG